MYYLSVYVKSFKELFLYSLRESVFLKSECKSTTIFRNHQIFSRKSFDFNSVLTVRGYLWRFLELCTLLYIRTHEYAKSISKTWESQTKVWSMVDHSLVNGWPRAGQRLTIAWSTVDHIVGHRVTKRWDKIGHFIHIRTFLQFTRFLVQILSRFDTIWKPKVSLFIWISFIFHGFMTLLWYFYDTFCKINRKVS